MFSLVILSISVLLPAVVHVFILFEGSSFTFLTLMFESVSSWSVFIHIRLYICEYRLK